MITGQFEQRASRSLRILSLAGPIHHRDRVFGLRAHQHFHGYCPPCCLTCLRNVSELSLRARSIADLPAANSSETWRLRSVPRSTSALAGPEPPIAVASREFPRVRSPACILISFVYARRRVHT